MRDYIRGAEVIIHNAPFDLGFLDAEFEPPEFAAVRRACAAASSTPWCKPRNMHPGKRNSLDALCDRYGISNAHRMLHGALLDAELLAEVYLAMTRGQNSLSIDLDVEAEAGGDGALAQCAAGRGSSCWEQARKNWPHTKACWRAWTRKSGAPACGAPHPAFDARNTCEIIRAASGG